MPSHRRCEERYLTMPTVGRALYTLLKERLTRVLVESL